MNNLGIFYVKQGRQMEAEALLIRAAAGKEQTYGADHPETKKAHAYVQEVQAARIKKDEQSATQQQQQQEGTDSMETQGHEESDTQLVQPLS